MRRILRNELGNGFVFSNGVMGAGGEEKKGRSLIWMEIVFIAG